MTIDLMNFRDLVEKAPDADPACVRWSTHAVDALRPSA